MGISGCCNRHVFEFSVVCWLENKFLIGPNGEQLGIIAAGKVENNQSEKEKAPARSIRQNAREFLAWAVGGVVLFGVFTLPLSLILSAHLFLRCVLLFRLM